jgi:lipid II isoglutaminyl synthase (glutamine-hydrolysing)
MVRIYSALWLAALVRGLIVMLKKGSGSSLPGKLALKIAPNVVAHFSQKIRSGIIAITGTNGKSTTAGLTAAMLQQPDKRFGVLHNTLGANMLTGITSAFLKHAKLNATLDMDYAVLEVDEASLKAVTQQAQPQVIVVTNLFRDQLDRYGELDITAQFIVSGIQMVERPIVLLNADDPLVYHLSCQLAQEIECRYFGLAQNVPQTIPTSSAVIDAVGFAREMTDCPVCKTALTYDFFIFGHLGHYHCSQCHFKRPQPEFSIQNLIIAPESSQFDLVYQQVFHEQITLNLPGVFNAYNVLAAWAGASILSKTTVTVQPVLEHYQSLFGRAESLTLQGKRVCMMLIKNPAGTGEVLKTVLANPEARLCLLINDLEADGRDISWLWDAPFELLIHLKHAPVFVGGRRAEEMALRLKYAGVPEALIQMVNVEGEHATADRILNTLEAALETVQPLETLYILPTYTALLQLNRIDKTGF